MFGGRSPETVMGIASFLKLDKFTRAEDGSFWAIQGRPASDFAWCGGKRIRSRISISPLGAPQNSTFAERRIGITAGWLPSQFPRCSRLFAQHAAGTLSVD